MRHKKGIIVFVVVFCVMAFLPFLVNINQKATGPSIDTTTAAAYGQDSSACVASTDYMMTSHMQMLNSWRNDAVRNGQTTYVGPDGQEFALSMDESCLQCHDKRENFCDSCHDYAGVQPSCWECHDRNQSDTQDGAKQ